MGFGLCLGGFGIGKCGKTSSSQSVNIANSAVASAYYKNAFSCKQKIDSGNNVTAEGVCGCQEEQIYSEIDCRQYKLTKAKLEAQECATSSKNSNLTGAELTCICHSGGAGCNIGIDQRSAVSNQFVCKNKQSAKANLDNHFSNDMVQNMKQNMSDIGGLFDSNDQKVTGKIATKIRQNISQSMMNEISSKITASNNVTAGCGGLNFGITQYSQMDTIVSVLSKSSAIQEALNQLKTHLKSSVTRVDSGFLGWLTSTAGIIVIIIVCIAVIIGLSLLFKYKPWKKKTK